MQFLMVSECPETCVKSILDGILVQMLPDEYEFLHAVSVTLIPIPPQCLILGEPHLQLIWRHGREPLPHVAQRHLLAGLFKQIAYVRFRLEITYPLGANDAGRPFFSHEIIKTGKVKRSSRIIHICTDAVLLDLATLVVVMVMSVPPLMLMYMSMLMLMSMLISVSMSVTVAMGVVFVTLMASMA